MSTKQISRLVKDACSGVDRPTGRAAGATGVQSSSSNQLRRILGLLLGILYRVTVSCYLPTYRPLLLFL